MANSNESAFDIDDDDFDSMFESSLSHAEESDHEKKGSDDAEKKPKDTEPEQVSTPEEIPVEKEPVVEEEVIEPAPVPEEPEPIMVTPITPKEVRENVISIPEVEGVEYVVNNDNVVGEIEVQESGIEILAYPLYGYVLNESVDIEWSFDFIAPPKPVESEPVVEEEVLPQEQDNDFDDNTSGKFDPGASQAYSIKSGVDQNVSLETLQETIKILDAYRSLEDDEAEFSGIFIGLEENFTEADVISSVMNADPLLFDVFSAIKESKTYDDTEIAFYIVGLKWEILEGISFVASQYLGTDSVSQGNKASKIAYARAIVSQIKELDSRAIRLIDATESLLHGEPRDNDADLTA